MLCADVVYCGDIVVTIQGYKKKRNRKETGESDKKGKRENGAIRALSRVRVMQERCRPLTISLHNGVDDEDARAKTAGYGGWVEVRM
jgi:hypothetical protein